jgi:hypothetical protein
VGGRPGRSRKAGPRRGYLSADRFKRRTTYSVICPSDKISLILSDKIGLQVRPPCRFLALCFGCFLVFSMNSIAGTFSGNVSDLDAGDGYLTVTNPADQTTQTFKVTSETVIVTAEGKPSQLSQSDRGSRR